MQIFGNICLPSSSPVHRQQHEADRQWGARAGPQGPSRSKVVPVQRSDPENFEDSNRISSLGANSIKLFYFPPMTWANKLVSVFVPDKTIRPSLIFAGQI